VEVVAAISSRKSRAESSSRRRQPRLTLRPLETLELRRQAPNLCPLEVANRRLPLVAVAVASWPSYQRESNCAR